MHGTGSNNVKLFFIFVLATNKKVVKSETSFLLILGNFLNDNQFFDIYNIKLY